MSRVLRALCAVLIASAAAAGPAAARVFDPTSFPHANGRQLVVVGYHNAPIVSHMV